MRQFVAFLLAILLPLAVSAAEWEAKWYDPKPAAGDFTLPLPCGGRMVFRPVEVPVTPGALDDRPITLGDPDPAVGYSEFVRGAALAAPFLGADGMRRYWIGKYDVTRDQYAALLGKDCPTPSPGGRVPITMISQIDAMQAAASWSSWLLSNAVSVLPKRGDALAYARLPTEEEWEFAARGGTKVSAEAFLSRTWPMPEGITRYVIAGRAASGRPQQVGEMLPNPLGLYDMLGNVGQMMLEPYRLNRVGRLHGAAGGVVVRGGSYAAQPAELHTAMRTEIPPFDPRAKAPTRLSFVGFRLVLSAPTAGTLAEAEAEKTAFATLLAQGEEAVADNDPRKLVARLKTNALDPTQRQALDELDAKLANDERQRGDTARVALAAQIESAALMACSVASLDDYAGVMDRLAENFSNHPDNVKAYQGEAARRRLVRDGSLDGYLRTLRDIVGGPSRRNADPIFDLVRREMDNRGQSQLEVFLPIIQRDMHGLLAGQPPTPERLLADIIAATSGPSGC